MAAKIILKGGDKIPNPNKNTTTATGTVQATPVSGNKPAGTYEVGGETKQGYIKDGVTYTDKSYTTQVPVGSKVYTNNGVFIKSGGGGLKMDATPVSAGAPAKSGNATPVTYTVDGTVRQGYIKDGATYTDPGMTQRVPIGAIVHTPNGSTYEMTANGGVPTSQTQINDFKNQSAAYLNAYAAAQKAQEQKIDANVQAAINRLNAQKEEAEQAKKEADRAAYSAYLRAINPYGANAQQVAKLGLGGSGFSETNLASMGNQYQENLNRAILERDAALRNIGLKIEEARLAGDAQKAEALSAYYQNVANMSLNIAQTNASIAQNAANAAYARSRDAVADKQYADERAYNREQNALSTAFQLVDKGVTPENVAKILNLSPELLGALQGYYASRQIAVNNVDKSGIVENQGKRGLDDSGLVQGQGIGNTLGRLLATPWMLTNQNVYEGEDELNFNFGD